MERVQLDEDTFYRAIASRDRRFDGRFVVAVKTTHIYCRPGCPARLPRRQNVTFYACAAAAEEAGFRPCMRCRPETSPGSPAAAGTSATVARALRLLCDGALDDSDVDDLASRLGVGARHLRRLFAEHLGASPRAIALTRRVHFARKLVDETAMPMGEIAMASGFASIRRFNDAFRRTFHKPPRAVRRSVARDANDDALALTLPLRQPFDWEGLLAFLRPRATPGVEVVDATSYRRAVAIDAVCGAIEVTHVPGSSRVRLRVSTSLAPHLLAVAERVTRIFDLSADPHAIAAHLERDARLTPLVAARPGLRVPGAWDGFELAVRAVLGQQVTVAGATTLAGRLAATCGKRVTIAGAPELTRVFPTAAVIARADLGAVGLTKARAEALRTLAIAVRSGAIALDGSRSVDETRAALCALRGIGPWTAEYVAMRALGEPDAFPSGDLALRKAMDASERDLEARSNAWRPWRAYAAMHLWTSGGTR